MKFRQLIRDYFTFSRNERRGITILLIIIFLLAITNKVIFKFETPARIDSALLDSSRVKLGAFNDSVTANSFSRKLFVFDPNIIDTLALDSLNISENIKRNLVKYRNMGGKFHAPEDFRKLYGMTELIYNRVAPFLKIQDLEKKRVAEGRETRLFPFDPNTASDEEFMQLGLSPRQITTIRNYQAKAGRFKSRDDFFKIYSLTSRQKRRFADFVQIQAPSKTPEKTNLQEPDKILIDLNTVDTLQLEQLPGIGVKLSRRILKYRELLGGFYDIRQLKEVYGLNEQTIQKIESQLRIDERKIRKLDLNFGDPDELARHPYLKRKLANRIVQFRSIYGKINDPRVLQDSMILNIEEYKKIKPYL